MPGADRPPTSALSQARILVTRPAAQAADLCAAITARGGEALALPLIGIAALDDTDAVQSMLRESLAADWWVFTSTNAVRFAAAALPPPWPARLAAVGPATARALGALGCRVAVAPDIGASSEALLDLPGFAPLAGERVAIVTGEEGRELLADSLCARGLRVETLAIYRRLPLWLQPEVVVPMLEAADAIVVTSAQTLDQLIAVTPAGHQALLRGKQLALPSRRVVAHAAACGFALPALVPATVSDEAFAEILSAWWRQRSGAGCEPR